MNTNFYSVTCWSKDVERTSLSSGSMSDFFSSLLFFSFSFLPLCYCAILLLFLYSLDLYYILGRRWTWEAFGILGGILTGFWDDFWL